MKKVLPLILASLLFLVTQSAFADYTGDLSISPTDVKVPTDIIEGQSIRIYATVKNNSDKDLVGVVKFYNENLESFIGTDQPVSLIANGTDDVFINWKASSVGNHSVAIRVNPWEESGDNPENNKVTKTVYVDRDSDKDGVGDRNDADDDNDGVYDNEDAFPNNPDESKDTDKDGIGDNEDEDDDNDGVADIEDAFPIDPNESKDSDGDGIGDNADKFPNNPSETKDTDEDGLGDNADPDSQNHGPIPYIETENKKVSVGELVGFNAIKSRDPDGEVVNYEWILGDGTEKTGVLIDHAYGQRGEYKVVLKVTDEKGEYRKQELTIIVGHKWQTIALFITTLFLLLILFGHIIFSKKEPRRMVMMSASTPDKAKKPTKKTILKKAPIKKDLPKAKK